ncbi:hypothetical protein ACLOAV_010213 [Pseudogymnoascus australis]
MSSILIFIATTYNGLEVQGYEEGADVNAKDIPNHRTPLYWAAEYGQEAVVKPPLDTGKVDVDSKGKDEKRMVNCGSDEEEEQLDDTRSNEVQVALQRP